MTQQKSENLAEKSPTVKKIELTIKKCGISPGIPGQLFFVNFGPVLTNFWPFYQFCTVGPMQGSRANAQGVFGVKKSPEKRGAHSGPKDASSAYLFFIRVTELVFLQGTNLGLHLDYLSAGGRKGYPPPPPTPILAGPYLRPIDPKSKISKLTGQPEQIGHKVVSKKFR